MRLTKKLIPVAIVFLFMGIAFAPALNATDDDPKTVGEHTMTVYMPGITEGDYKRKIMVDDAQLKDVETAVTNSLTLLEDLMKDGFTKGEVAELIESVMIVINKIQELDDEFPEEFIGDFDDTDGDGVIGVQEVVAQTISSVVGISIPLSRAAIFSIGRGWCWIPFYDYETFLGVMLRPMFMSYAPGFTAVVHFNLLPPRLEYADRLGLYRVRTLLFVGLFVNFGDIGLDRIAGPMLILGKSLNHLGMDLP